MTDQTDHCADPVQAVAEVLAGHPSMESEPGYNPWTCAGCGMQLAEGRKSRALEAFGHHLASVAVAAARPAIEREAKAEAWDEGFTRGFYDVLAGGDRDASESAAENPYRAALATGATTNPQEADQ